MREGYVMTAGARPAGQGEGSPVIDGALAAAREYLEMPLAYLSEFDGDAIVIRHVEQGEGHRPLKVGLRVPSSDSYCGHILAGRLPQVIPDTSQVMLCRSLSPTTCLPVRSHAGVPVRRPDGSVYGMFCCASPEPHPTLNPRDLKVLRMFAAQAEEQVVHDLLRYAHLDSTAAQIDDMLRSRQFDVVFQPIYRLDDGKLASFEALTRFRSDPYRTPDRWFADAEVAGMQADLEIMVIERALASVADLGPNVRMSVNASSDTVSSGRLLAPFERYGANRITLEITEHNRSANMAALLRSIDALRRSGAHVAIDDVGVGYSGLHQILKLRPDILKLDMSLVRDIDVDPARRALAAALVSFASGTGARLTAEGIERLEECEVLQDLGINYGQGWLLGRPGPLAGAAPMAPILNTSYDDASSRRKRTIVYKER